MRIKQTWVGISLALVFAMVSTLVFQTTFLSPTSYAEYPPNAEGKCENGSDASQRRNRETRVMEKYCADSTKSTTSTPPAPATQDQATNDTGTDAALASDADADSVTCAVEKIGWILCPIMEGAAKISDKAFDILADNFLRTDPELIRDDSGTKIGWEVARNLANIMFIIAFLIIIFSQVTGRGLNNYGIKKMLPRLIVAAILVNLSYYICQLAVDGTNILGYEIQNAMAQIANTVGPSVFGQVARADTETATGLAPLQNGGILAMTVTLGLASVAVVWFLLPTMAALIPLILITVATIIIVLLLRKAFIVLLIVLSPIAFVMYLLPNTERYFDKWRSMFVQLLLVFPIVGLLFGAGQLASTIILVAGSNNGQAAAAESCNPDDEGARSTFNKDKSANDNALCGEPSVTVQGGKNGNSECFAGNACKAEEPYNATITTGLVATGIAIAPLLAVWAVLKGALSAAGAIGGKISGAVEKGVRGGVNGSVKGIGDKYKSSTFGQMRARDKKLREIDIREGNYEGKNPVRRGRNNLNKYLNKEGSALDKVLSTGSQSGYAKQRGRIASKGSNEWITEKAQEFRASGEAGSDEKINKIMDTLRDSGKTASEKKSAMDELRAHRLAVQGTPLGSALDEKISNQPLTGMAGSDRTYIESIGRNYNASESHIAKQQQGQANALAQALRPHINTINPQAQAQAAQRQLNNTQPPQPSQPSQSSQPPQNPTPPNTNTPNSGNSGGQNSGGSNTPPPQP